MKVAVITPYFKTPLKWLTECHASVRAQTHPCTHIIVADGQPYNEVDSWVAQHIKFPVNAADYGDTPRGTGSVVAIGQGFDAIACLDADNWYDPEHISTLVNMHKKTRAAVVTSARNLHRLDGTLLGKCYRVDGKSFVDTNCLLLTRAAFDIIKIWWRMDPRYHPIGDRVVWANIIRRNFSRSHSEKATVAYRTAFAFHYEHFGEKPPEGAKSGRAVWEALKVFNQKEMQHGRITVRINK